VVVATQPAVRLTGCKAKYILVAAAVAASEVARFVSLRTRMPGGVGCRTPAVMSGQDK